MGGPQFTSGGKKTSVPPQPPPGITTHTQDTMPSGPELTSGRVSEACARCRRQKLKCDATKPCTMCVRSGMACQPRVVPEAVTRRRKASDSEAASDSPRTRRPRTASTAESARQTSPQGVSPLGRQVAESVETRQFGANRSTISLAMNMYQSLGTHAPTASSTIPGDASPGSSNHPVWTLQSMRMPPQSTMEALIGLYFDKLHWFIWIFHEPSFVTQSRHILSATAWRREDRSKILATLTVAALGLKCAIQNTTPQSRRFLASVSPDPKGLMNQMIAEVRLHLLDLLDDSRIETVQVCLLLGAFYIFHGSPSLAWAMIGMSVRASYALALHCESDSEDQIATQVRRRCWNHLTVADTFASQIYGRPASLDPAFSDLLPLAQMDDTPIDVLPNDFQGHADDGMTGPVTALTFHWLKYKLYEIIRETLSTFRLLRLHSPMTAEDLHSLIDAVQRIDARLAEWRTSLPAPFSSDDLSDDGRPQQSSFFEDDLGENTNPSLRRLKFQAWLLRNTYDAAVILAHRPLLEYRVSADYRRGIPRSSADLVSRSFDVSVKAALRMSRTPVMQFEHEFCLAFIFVHLFTAGVILCIPPTSHPHSSIAQESKSGVFRIIQAAKALRPHSQIARHAEQLLSDLLKLSLHREVDMAFKDDRRSEQSADAATDSGAWSGDRQVTASEGDTTQGHLDDALVPESMVSVSETLPSLRQQDGDSESLEQQWSEEPYLLNTDGSDFQPLDLPLDEAFGAFGQVMFNLMPDDPLNNWGWGKGSM